MGGRPPCGCPRSSARARARPRLHWLMPITPALRRPAAWRRAAPASTSGLPRDDEPADQSCVRTPRLIAFLRERWNSTAPTMIAPVSMRRPASPDRVEAQDLLQVPDGEDADEGQHDAAPAPHEARAPDHDHRDRARARSPSPSRGRPAAPGPPGRCRRPPRTGRTTRRRGRASGAPGRRRAAPPRGSLPRRRRGGPTRSRARITQETAATATKTSVTTQTVPPSTRLSTRSKTRGRST